MLTNRRSTMMMPPSRMPSWHPQSKPYPPSPSVAPATFDADVHPSRTPALLTATTSALAGHRVIRALGACHGTVSLARKDTKSFIKNIASTFGSNWGEAKSLTSAIYSARDQAVERMVKEAVGKGANAVVGVEIRETDVLGCVVVSVSGTGVWVEKEREGQRGEKKRDSAQEGQEDPFI